MRNKRDWRDTAMNAFIVAVFLAAGYLGVSYEMGLWNECRADHSWGYCMRVLSNKH